MGIVSEEERQMVQVIFGVLLLGGTAFLWGKYRPKKRDSLELCLLCTVMGVCSLFLSDGVWWLQATGHLMQAVVFACCLLELRREWIFRQRAIRRMAKAVRPVPKAAKTSAVAVSRFAA